MTRGILVILHLCHRISRNALLVFFSPFLLSHINFSTFFNFVLYFLLWIFPKFISVFGVLQVNFVVLKFCSKLLQTIWTIILRHYDFHMDDMMIFCDVDVRQMGYLRCIFGYFEVVLGLKINLAKRELFQMGEERDIESMTWILGCKIGCLPSTYLLAYHWVQITNQMWYGIWLLKRDLLKLIFGNPPLMSKGGRLTLVKATLVAMPNYLSSFIISASVANRMEAMFRRFLWHDGSDHHGYHLVDLNTCCKHIINRGLGIRSICFHNKALLAKWL